MASCNVSLQIIPLVAGDKLYPLVDRVIDMIAASGVRYIVGPMETCMEGELDELLGLVKQAQDLCIAAGADRILSAVKIDYSSRGVTMDEKVDKYRGQKY